MVGWYHSSLENDTWEDLKGFLFNHAGFSALASHAMNPNWLFDHEKKFPYNTGRYCTDTEIFLSKAKEKILSNDVIKKVGRREGYLFGGRFFNLKMKKVSLSSSFLLRKLH